MIANQNQATNYNSVLGGTGVGHLLFKGKHDPSQLYIIIIIFPNN